ncbi:MAG: oligosaccharide flippase family protein [Ignavibacteriae bacterium]|nr:oligosaccharide flippase family protein [Ignavibacteriota bacterium]
MISSSTAPHTQREEILKRTFSGAKWMLYLSGSALVAGFCTNVLLGRLGAEMLGLYTLLMLIVSMIQTFFVFGASNVLVNYLPNLQRENKPKFILSYSVLVYGVGAMLLGICLLFPQVMGLVFKSELNISTSLYLIVLVPILLAQVLVWAILQAELEGTVLAISQNAVSWFYLVTVALLFVTGFLTSESSGSYLFTAIVAANVIAFLIGIVYVRREYLPTGSFAGSWFLPKGFWSFTLALHFGTLFNFLITNAAPMFVVRELSLRDLGYYRAAAVFAGFVPWVPSVFDRSFYPSFCNLVSKKLPTHDVYGKFARLNAMSSGIVALTILLFAREFLSVFGKEFSDSSYIMLALLAIGYVVSTPFVSINFALVTAHLKTPHTMAAYAITAFCGIVLFSILAPAYGLLGIGIAFIGLQIVLLAFSIGLTWHFTRSQFPLRAFAITLLVTAVGSCGAYYFGTVSLLNTAIKAGMFVLFFVSLIATRLITIDEVKEMLRVLLPQSRTIGVQEQ